jgi:hypothetical protein
MKHQLRQRRSHTEREPSFSLDRKLASYLAASASIGVVMAREAKAVIVSNNTVQNIGINSFATIDFNHDGQTDFQIDHDRVDLTAQGGPVVDYLQVDKNDINGASAGENLLAFDPGPGATFKATPFQDGPSARNNANESGYLVDQPNNFGQFVQYPTALLANAEIGPNQAYDYQEGNNVYGSGKIGRLNRLIDEDHGQADVLLGGTPPDGVITPTNTPQFLGVQNQVRYLGVRMDLNSASGASSPDPTQHTYGWVGIKITNEADATGQVVGYGYETQPGVSILAGATAPGIAGDYNNNGKVDAADYVLWRNGGPLQNESVTLGSTTPEDYAVWRSNFGNSAGSGAALGSSTSVPEPGSLILSLLTGLGLIATYFCRRYRGR